MSEIKRPDLRAEAAALFRSIENDPGVVFARKQAEIAVLRARIAEGFRPEGETLEGVIAWICEDDGRKTEAIRLLVDGA